jgi:ATP-dependent Zn protease
MDEYLNRSYEEVKEIVLRNRVAFEALMLALLEGPTNSLTGQEVRDLVERLADPQDLARRKLDAAAFL